MDLDEKTSIGVATRDEDIMKCFPTLQELRPHLEQASFLERVRAQQTQGYQLACVTHGGMCLAVAGFRIVENFAWGRFLYVDDLVTAATARSGGHGASLIAWLEGYGREHGCQQLHLDSGAQRKDAHRFYLREHYDISCFHFEKHL
ncbi:MAG: GNAT family N-acetyltransferase [Deinococcota bacterium]|nr:GNAT family N-acetyltransferase [Deinococcota bacterium]